MVILIIFIAVQFYPAQLPPTESVNLQDMLLTEEVSLEVMGILKTSCYDCHSNETIYPWYSSVAPISWWLGDHIRHGREELNFSEWGKYSIKRKKHKMEEVAELIESDEMPLPSYLWSHWDARITAEQKESLISWAESLQIKLSTEIK